MNRKSGFGWKSDLGPWPSLVPTVLQSFRTAQRGDTDHRFQLGFGPYGNSSRLDENNCAAVIREREWEECLNHNENTTMRRAQRTGSETRPSKPVVLVKA